MAAGIPFGGCPLFHRRSVIVAALAVSHQSELNDARGASGNNSACASPSVADLLVSKKGPVMNYGAKSNMRYVFTRQTALRVADLAHARDRLLMD